MKNKNKIKTQNKRNPQIVSINQSPFKSGEAEQLMSDDYVLLQI